MSLHAAETQPKYGLLTSPLESVPDEILRFGKLGFDYVEIGIEEPQATPQILMRQNQAILRSLSETGLFTLGHTAYWVGFGSSHEKVRRGWVEEAKDMIQVASQLRIDLLNFHYNARLGNVGVKQESRNNFVKNFSNSMSELTQLAESMNIQLMLENPPPQGFNPLEGIDYFAQVIDSVPKLRFHLDVAHAYIENGMEGINQYLDAFGDKLVHVHMHDNHGKQDEHLALGQGKINFRKVVKALKDSDYCRTITFEVFTSHADAVQSREHFKKYWKSIT